MLNSLRAPDPRGTYDRQLRYPSLHKPAQPTWLVEIPISYFEKIEQRARTRHDTMSQPSIVMNRTVHCIQAKIMFTLSLIQVTFTDLQKC